MKSLRLLLPLAALVGSSQAAIIYSGLQDIPISTTFVGTYLDIDGGGTVAEETTGWDINPFFGGEGIASSPSFHPVTATIDLDATILSLTPGQTINGSSTFATPYPGGFSGSASHVGNVSGQFANGSQGFIGFNFTTNENVGPLYGWLRVTLSNTGSTGTIHDWAYENTGGSIAVGTIPEPASVTLLGACAALLAFCRRRYTE